MTKILDKLETVFTGQQFPYRTSVLNVDLVRRDTGIPQDISTLQEYDISIQIGTTIRCMETEKQRMLEKVLENVRYEIYGDIIQLLNRLGYEIHGQENDKAMETYREIEKIVLE